MTIEISMSGVIDEGYFTARIVEDLVTEITDRVTDSVVRQIDLRDLAAEFDTYDVAQYVCTSDVASNIDVHDVAQELNWYEISRHIDMGDLVKEIDFDDLLDDETIIDAIGFDRLVDEVVRRLRSGDDTIQTYDGVQESTDALAERVKVLEERLNGVLLLLDNFSCDASRTDLRVIADRHPVL